MLRFVFVPPRLGGRLIGRTADSDSAYPGSSPGLPAKIIFDAFIPQVIPREKPTFHPRFSEVARSSSLAVACKCNSARLEE